MLLLDSLFKDNKIPPLDMVECNECHEHSNVSDCESGIEQESWEMPEYTIHFCQYCNSDDLEYYPSKEYELKYWKEIYGDEPPKEQ